jgi:ABC-type uncharacterized transport system substrate-binding protein
MRASRGGRSGDGAERRSIRASEFSKPRPTCGDARRHYAVHILRGAKPADLPVQAPNKFQQTNTMKTAKALGLTVLLQLLVSADHAIE